MVLLCVLLNANPRLKHAQDCLWLSAPVAAKCVMMDAAWSGQSLCLAVACRTCNLWRSLRAVGKSAANCARTLCGFGQVVGYSGCLA